MTRLSKTIKEYVKCPQLGSEHFGEWGALRKDQRLLIHQLCEECEEQEHYADEFYKNKVALQKENAVLRKALELACDDILINVEYDCPDVNGDIGCPVGNKNNNFCEDCVRCEKIAEYIQQAKEQRDDGKRNTKNVCKKQ